MTCPDSTALPVRSSRQPDEQPLFALPTKLPFFKSHRRKILQAKVSELLSRGPIDDATEAKLGDFAIALGLKKSDATDNVRRGARYAISDEEFLDL